MAKKRNETLLERLKRESMEMIDNMEEKSRPTTQHKAQPSMKNGVVEPPSFADIDINQYEDTILMQMRQAAQKKRKNASV
jgi:hypothetical protein